MDPADYAYTQLGVYELTGSNDGIPAERYMRGDELAWCAGFAMWCFDEAARPIYRNTAEYYRFRKVSTLWASLKRRGRTTGPNVSPQRNMLIFYKNRSGSDKSPQGSHVGVVEYTSEVYCYSIEGNLSNKVMRRRIRLTDEDILGYADPG